MRWRFWRRRDVHGANELMAAMQWEAGMVDAGWRHWMSAPPLPSEHEFVEIKRREWPSIGICRLSSMGPETNVYGLWWKPARPGAGDAGTIIELRKTPLGYV